MMHVQAEMDAARYCKLLRLTREEESLSAMKELSRLSRKQRIQNKKRDKVKSLNRSSK